MVISFGTAVAQFWNQPDQGIWEFRHQALHHTHSKVMCWVAMDRIGKLATRHLWKLPFSPEKVAADIRQAIETKAYNPQLQCYTRAFGEPELDGNLLVMPLVGYCDPNDPKFISTREAIIKKLSRNDLIYRYPLVSDGFNEPEGAFTLCNFWLAECFARAGDIQQAQRWLNAVLRSSTETSLLAEQVDPEKLNALGNFPQGFSHIGLINAAVAIDRLQADQNRYRRVTA
jgi:GH15 family glucan-1,4-alpha-glucosidase